MCEKTQGEQKNIVRSLMSQGASLVGFGDVSLVDRGLSKEYPVLISIGIKYDERIVENLHRDEEAFHVHLSQLNTKMNHLLKETEALLEGWNYKYRAIPSSVAIKDNEQLRNLQCFSHKMAAACAGLGWIGKSSLLVTPPIRSKA